MNSENIHNAVLNMRGWIARGEAPSLDQVRDTLALLGDTPDAGGAGPEVGWCIAHEKEHFLAADGSCYED